jgi:fatty acid synthase subunit beta
MAPPGQDQGRVAFSKRKAIFNARFLPINVPFHSQYLQGTTERVLADIGGSELWSPKDISMAIYHTEDGEC